MPTEDPSAAANELLLILLRNLRNAAATFGEGTPPYESIRTMLEDHLRDMQRRGIATALTSARDLRNLGLAARSAPAPVTFSGTLAFRPKSDKP